MIKKWESTCFVFVPMQNMSSDIFLFMLRACSHGKKLSRLARKPFDKFTSEISPSYVNAMKSHALTFI